MFQTASAFVVAAAGFVLCASSCTKNGPIKALAGTVTQIDTPIAGIVSVTNLLDQSVIGTLAESDPALRLRRERTIRAMGGSAFEAVRARVIEVPGVTDCFVFENETDATVDTIPPHSFEVVVRGGTDTAVATAIFNAKSLAIRAFGSTSVNIADTQGNLHAIGFTRPATLNAYVSIAVLVAAGYPSNLVDLIKAAVVAYGDLNYRTGSPVYGTQLIPATFGASSYVLAAGYLTPVKVDVVSPAVTESVVPTKRQIVDLDTTRVTVTLTPSTI